MPEVIESTIYARRFAGLRDRVVRTRIAARVDRLASGNPGDHRGVGEGVMELRLTFGSGFRVYYMEAGRELVILLAGGDKSSQEADIIRAKQVAAAWRSAEWKR